MKIKIDFVTNSSTTSFCILGVRLNDYFDGLPEKLREKIFQEGIKIKSKEDSNVISLDWIEGNYEWILEGLANKIGLDVNIIHDDGIYVGLSVDKLPDDKTIIQIKEDIKEKLNSIDLSENIKVDFIIGVDIDN